MLISLEDPSKFFYNLAKKVFDDYFPFVFAIFLPFFPGIKLVKTG